MSVTKADMMSPINELELKKLGLKKLGSSSTRAQVFYPVHRVDLERLVKLKLLMELARLEV